MHTVVTHITGQGQCAFGAMPQPETLDCSDTSAGTTPQDESAVAASPPRCAALACCAHALPRPALQLHRARNNHSTVIAHNCQHTESHDSHCNSETARVPLGAASSMKCINKPTCHLDSVYRFSGTDVPGTRVMTDDPSQWVRKHHQRHLWPETNSPQ